MASEIKANKISPATGTDLTIGDSGDTLSIASDTLYVTNNKVGIGTSSPSKALHVETSTNGGILLTDTTNSITGIYYSSANNSLALGSTTNHPVKFLSNNTERMRIDTSGNMLMGGASGIDFKQRILQSANYGVCSLNNTLSSGLVYDQFQITVQNAASNSFFFERFYSSGGTQQFGVKGNGVIYAQNTSVQSISDARVKENVRDSEQGLDVITALRPVRFDFKEGFGNDQKNQLGFIAQEVEAVFPDAVMTASEKMKGESLKSLGPAALIPVLVKSIQEQQTIIEDLQTRLSALEANQ